MTEDDYTEFDCDLCGSADAAEITVARRYTNDQPIHVCRNCGFVYVRRRRSAERIAAAWTHEIYGDGYTARIPAVKARQIYVAETADVEIGLADKTLCDFGGGEGQFLDIVRDPDYGAIPFAVEPSPENCRAMAERGIECFCGNIEAYQASGEKPGRGFDIVTIMWTIENCQSCRTMMDAAYDALADGGHLVIATGSRILVPFKKPLQYYLSTNPADTHAFRFSANSLKGLFAVSGFEVTYVNRYLDTDYLVVIGRKAGHVANPQWDKDDHLAVIDFFERWDRETQGHYRDA